MKKNKGTLIMLSLVVCVFGLGHSAAAADQASGPHDFSFMQLSDTHWGLNDPKLNPDPVGTLKKTIAAINSLNAQPDFIVFTGDLTHTTDDANERRTRLMGFRDAVKALKVQDLKFLPGEHDAGLDNAAAYQEVFGQTHYTFDHNGVHFIVLDNGTDPTSSIGEAQLQWFQADLKKLAPDARIVILTHRPLFDLFAKWDWWTRDGAAALDLLKPYKNVIVFYGHIHQEHHQMTEQIAHHAAQGLMFPLPAPGSVPERVRIPWDPAAPYKGLGYRRIDVKVATAEYVLTEYPVKAAEDSAEPVIKITAKKFAYLPNEVKLKKGVPVVLELTSADRLHGFNCPDLKIRADVKPGETVRVRVVPEKIGTFGFYCDVFCGEGHADMTGKIIVEE